MPTSDIHIKVNNTDCIYSLLVLSENGEFVPYENFTPWPSDDSLYRIMPTEDYMDGTPIRKFVEKYKQITLAVYDTDGNLIQISNALDLTVKGKFAFYSKLK